MKVLSIDGGGIRGLIPALVLAEIERRTARRIGECFDLIAGTSTGGIIACALAKPDPLPAAELADLYVEEGPRIFRRGLLKRILSVEGLVDERYDDDGLNDTLARYLGEARLSQCRPAVMVTAYDIEGRFAFFFRSPRAERDPTYDFALTDVARATSGAPTYFQPARVTDVAGDRTYALVDGGVFAVNPALCAYVDVLRAGAPPTLLASLGTGEQTRVYPYEKARSWGQLEWARPLIDIVFDGIADTVEFQLAGILGDRYTRLQVALRDASGDLDDASEDNLAALRREAERLIRDQTAAIDRLCAAVT